jgi:hypothetical protein
VGGTCGKSLQEGGRQRQVEGAPSAQGRLRMWLKVSLPQTLSTSVRSLSILAMGPQQPQFEGPTQSHGFPGRGGSRARGGRKDAPRKAGLGSSCLPSLVPYLSWTLFLRTPGRSGLG